MNKNAKAFNTIKTESTTIFKPVNLKTILKLEGIRDHSFYAIQNDSTFEIQKVKYDESESKLIKSNWTFDLDKVYQEPVAYQDLYLSEVIDSNFFTKLKKHTEKIKSSKTIKATKIFLSRFSDSFSAKGACLPSAYLRFILADILNNQNFFLTEADLENEISVITTVSFCEIFENRILDNFNFSGANKANSNSGSVNSNNSCSFKIFEYEDEVVIDGVKEVQIAQVEQFDKLIELFLEKSSNNDNNQLRVSKNFKAKQALKLENNYDNISHELFTVKVYKKLNCPKDKLKFKDNPIFQPSLAAKLKFALFRGFALLNNKTDRKSFINFTKENFNFFNSINTGNYRIFKLSRCIKDTLESNNNYLYVSLPSRLEYIILVHDVLNNIRKRRTSVLSQIIERNIDENLIDNYHYISKSPIKYSTLDLSHNKSHFHNFSSSGSNLVKGSKNLKSQNTSKFLNSCTDENKENDKNISNVRRNCDKPYSDFSQIICKTAENNYTNDLNPINVENTNSYSSSNVSFNSLKREQKSSLSYTNEFLSDIEIDEDEGLVVNKLNLDRICKIEKNNLSIVFDNFDSMLGLD